MIGAVTGRANIILQVRIRDTKEPKMAYQGQRSGDPTRSQSLSGTAGTGHALSESMGSVCPRPAAFRHSEQSCFRVINV